ncbi:D-glycero-beta-D-manno-heptose-7-phosphate kinase [Nanoarchaeota archaeon]
MEVINLIRNMLGKRILVIGDLMLDKYVWGTVSRISPEAPVQIVDVSKESYAIGGAGNTAVNITTLGGEAFIIGVAGDDRSWKMLEEQMKGRRISVSGIILSDNNRTTRKVRVMGGKQQLLRFDYECKKFLDEHTENEIIKKIEEVVDDVDVILISDYAKGIVTQKVIDFVVEVSKRNNKKVVMDPKPLNKVDYNGAYLITPNQKEACDLVGWKDCPDDKIGELGNLLKERYGCAVLITRGEKGMVLFEDGMATNINTIAKDVFDVSGAGDTVVATLGLSLAAGATLQEAAVIANYAAGVVVGKLGTSTLTAEELENSIKNGKSNISR